MLIILSCSIVIFNVILNVIAVEININSFFLVTAVLITAVFFFISVHVGYDIVIVHIIDSSTYTGYPLDHFELSSTSFYLRLDDFQGLLESLGGTHLVQGHNLRFVFWRSDHLENQFELIVRSLGSRGEERLLDGLDTLVGVAVQVKGGSQLLGSSGHLLVDTIHKRSFLFRRDGNLRENQFWIGEDKLESIITVIKLVIQIPSECLIQINEFALHVEGSESHDEMDNFGLVELLLLVFDINELDCTLRQIDKPSFSINADNLHVILSSNTQMFLDVFNSLPGGVGSEDQSLSVVVL